MLKFFDISQFSSLQSLSRVWLFVTSWTVARQASLSITNSWSLPKLIPIELVMPFNHLMQSPSGCWYVWIDLSLVQFSSVAQSCLTLCDPMNCSTPGLPVHHQLPEFTQTHVHRVSDAIQPSISSSVVPFSCPQSLPASESFPMSQLFAWGGQSTGISASASFLPKKSQGWSPSRYKQMLFFKCCSWED